MVVLDALHWIQGNEAPDLAVRWNCKAAKCGSCGAEVNGRPRLTCKTRLSDFEAGEDITVEPMRTFPLIRDLVTDVSWNYEVNKSITPFTPAGGHPAVRLALAAAGHRARPGVPEVHRVLPVPGRLPRPPQPRDRAAVHGSALPRPGGRAGDAPDRPGRPARLPQGRRRGGLLQHHEVLHRGLPGAHQDHGQRDHPAQGARRRRVLRPDPVGLAQGPRPPGRAEPRAAARAARRSRGRGRPRRREPAGVRTLRSRRRAATPEPTGVAEPPAKVAKAARSKAKAKPKRPTRRRSDAGDETPSEG